MDILLQHITRRANSSGELAGPPQDLLLNCTSAEIAAERLPLAFAAITANPGHEGPQVVAAKLLELSRQRENMVDTWAGLSRRFPGNFLAARMHMRWLRRTNRPAEGIALLAATYGTDTHKEKAELLAELGLHDLSDTEFAALLAVDESDTKLRVLWAKLLQSRGAAEKAILVLDPVRQTGSFSASAMATIEKLEASDHARKLIDPVLLESMTLPSAALHQSILWFANRTIPRSVSANLGAISFVTGSLGAGGAERQMTRLACAMHERQISGTKIGNICLQAPVEMVITSISAAAGNDFFLPEVRTAKINLTVLSELVAESKDEIGLPVGAVDGLYPLLPKNAQFGLQRLVAHYRRVKPEVAYIWQDGAVLIAVLAALVAQVPRIIVSVRGMPPNLRQNLAKDEFRGMYQAIAKVPGVSLSSNSRTAADAYADWLGISRSSFTVIHNAIIFDEQINGEPDELLWEQFQSATGSESFTLGGVFRFDPNKRPLLWVEFAAQALRNNPDMRFVLVGSGALIEDARKLALALGVLHRILFVGHSRNVKFWLSKMNAVALLSEFEGLPNVLMEAQLAGIPVISTPAGGANETYIDELTGLTLRSAKSPELSDFLDKLQELVSSPVRRKIMGLRARSFAAQKFALPSILLQTVRYFKGRHPDARDKPAPLLLSKTA